MVVANHVDYNHILLYFFIYLVMYKRYTRSEFVHIVMKFLMVYSVPSKSSTMSHKYISRYFMVREH